MLHPSAQTRPITVREAWIGVVSDGTGGRCADTEKRVAMRRVPPGMTRARANGGALGFSNTKLPLDAPSPTITTGGGDFWHPVEDRVVTIAECKRVASFPDAYAFPRLDAEPMQALAWKRIGNSVPPFMARAIGLHLRKVLGR
jgi:DNA (cytosine-5)-methyltransferase 1